MQRYYSRIYWHFTGSPKGDVQVLSPDELLKKNKPKSDEESVNILMKILESQLLIASSQEQVGSYKTNRFCSTTDIPFKDLVEHAAYYGRTAIGFKAEAVHDVFLPVCYLSSKHESQKYLLELDHPLIDFIKITDFHPKEGHTFYREREWRNIGDFAFEKEEIAAIIVPDDALKRVHGCLSDLSYPEDISVLSWRLIEEA